MSDTIRIGLIGAGANTRSRHIPGFQALDGVEIVAVCNRSRESGQRVADEFGIPHVLDRWEQVLEQDDVDAICIGTWPYLHCPVTCAALDAGKHVLCEARMAMNAAEARQMLAKSQEHPDLVAQIVPSPAGLSVDIFLRELLADGYVGEVYEIVVRSLSDHLADPSTPLHWRQRADRSGLNVLALGIFNETVQRFFGDTASLVAQTHWFIAQRPDPDTGEMRAVDIPDSVSVLAEMASGATAVYHLSGVARHAGPGGMEVYGRAGTLHYDLDRTLRGAWAGDHELQEIPIPPEKAYDWHVEEDFIAAIRGERPVRLTTFADGVKYMDFTEAVHRSAQTGQRVRLPLA
jgi:predicted dehydrogenase